MAFDEAHPDYRSDGDDEYWRMMARRSSSGLDAPSGQARPGQAGPDWAGLGCGFRVVGRQSRVKYDTYDERTV